MNGGDFHSSLDMNKHEPFSLQEELLRLLRRQAAIEERLGRQRAVMQRITEGFAVLREWAARHAQRDLSLHDLLVLEAYGGGGGGGLCTHGGSVNEMSATTTTTTINSITDDNNNNNYYYEVGEGLQSARLQQEQQQELQLHEAKRAYKSFIHARVLGEGCTAPDNSVEFHTLTADSFYLLLPHLMELLQGLVDGKPPGITTTAVQLPKSSLRLSSLPQESSVSVAEWCASVACVLRFLELGIKYFPEVLGGSQLRPCIQKSLAQLQTHSSGGETNGNRKEMDEVLQSCQRASALCVRIHHLSVHDSRNYDHTVEEDHHRSHPLQYSE